MLRFLQIWASSVMTGMFCVLKETARMVCTLRWWIYSGLSNSFKKQNNKEGFTVADCAWNVGAGRCHKGYFPFFFFFHYFICLCGISVFFYCLSKLTVLVPLCSQKWIWMILYFFTGGRIYFFLGSQILSWRY